MQLRVARLCLDCEELHTDNACPVCASERYAFLSTWLPTEERRRWPRRVEAGREAPDNPIEAVTETIGRWIRGDESVDGSDSPRTRRSDHVAHLDFEDAARRDSAAPEIKPRPALKKRDA